MQYIKDGWAGLSPKGRAIIVVVVVVAGAALLAMAMWQRIDLLPYVEALK